MSSKLQERLARGRSSMVHYSPVMRDSFSRDGYTFGYNRRFRDGGSGRGKFASDGK